MKKKFIFSAVVFAAGSLISCPGLHALIFSKPQVEEVKCAEVKMQLFYYYLTSAHTPNIEKYTIECRKGKAPSVIEMPKWLKESLPGMEARKVWRDPVERGDLSEAALWQTPVSILYEFFNLTREKTFPQDENGLGMQPGLLVKEYAEIRSSFQMSVDRVYRARLADSLGGRGRTVLSIFNLTLKEMESIADAMSSANSQEFSDSVTAAAVLSQNAFSQMFSEPRGIKTETKPNPFQKLIPLVLKLVGMFMMFMAVKMLFDLNQEKIDEMTQDYLKRSKQWSEDFSRQFVQMKVQYLVGLPAVLFALAGIMTFNLFGFFILTAAGLYIGLHTPTWLLNHIKTRRGRQVDGQLMDALILLSNSLRSGLDIVQGFQMVSQDLIPPISEEFGLVIKNYQLGTSFEKALEGLEDRVSSRLLSYMIKAIILQRQVGGNLTKIFERIVDNIREEGKLEEKTKSLTAQQRIQSIVVGVMPWIMLAVMFIFQGQTMARFYFSGLGVLTLVFCAIWIAIGMKIVQSLGNIRV